MSMHWYVLDVNPEPWAVGPVGVARSGGKLKPYIGRNQQLAAYKEAVAEAIGEGQEKITGKVKLQFYFWRKRYDYTIPQSRSHRKHEADVTNMQKATEDALQGVLFDNDKDVNDIHSVLVEQGPDVHGRIVIGIEASPFLPEVMAELPQQVCDLLDHLDDEVPPDDRLSWEGDEVF